MGVKKTIEEVRELIEAGGYQLLTTEYKDAFGVLETVCSKGHYYKTFWNKWHNGARCYLCNGTVPKTIEFIKEEFAKEGYELLTTKYTNNKGRLGFICPEGHEYHTSWDKWQSGCRCGKCYYKDYTREELEEFEAYCRHTRNLSSRNYRKYKKLINPENIRRSKWYHLDHVYSVVDGFMNNVKAEIVASPANLRIISAKQNKVKNKKSSITKEELYLRYNKFIIKIGGT